MRARRLALVAAVAVAPAAALWALGSPVVDAYLTSRLPAWAVAAGVEVRLDHFDFDPWAARVRVLGLEAGAPGGGWRGAVRSLEVRVAVLRSLLGSIHLGVEAEGLRVEGEVPAGEGAGEERRGREDRLPRVVFDTLLVREAALDLAVPALALRLRLPEVAAEWVGNEGAVRVAGGAVSWQGVEEALEVVALRGRRRFAVTQVEELAVRSQRLGLRSSGRVGPWEALDLEVRAEADLGELPRPWLAALGLERFAPVRGDAVIEGRLEGRRDAPSFQGTVALGPGRFGPVAVAGGRTELVADRDGVNATGLELRTDAGRVTGASARVTWGSGIDLDAEGRVEGYHLRRFMALFVDGPFPVGGRASGTFAARGSLAPSLGLDCRVAAAVTDFDVTVGDPGAERTVFALPQGDLSTRAVVGADSVAFGATRLHTPSATVEIARGSVEYRKGLWFDTVATLRDLELVRQYVPTGIDARGLVRGRFGGPYDALRFEVGVDLASAVVGGEDLGRLRGRVEYDLREARFAQAELLGPLGRVTGEGAATLLPGGELDLEVAWTDGDLARAAGFASRLVGFEVPVPVSGAAEARGTLRGPLVSPRFAGTVGVTGAAVAGRKVESIKAEGEASAEGWAIERAEVAAGGAVATGAGRGDRDGFRAAGTVMGLALPRVAREAGLELPVEGRFAGTWSGAGTYRAPAVAVAGTVDDGAAWGHALGPLAVEGAWQDRRLTASLSGLGGRVRARGELELADALPFRVAGEVAGLPGSELPPGLVLEGLRIGSLGGEGRVAGTLRGGAVLAEVEVAARAEGLGWGDLEVGPVIAALERRPEGWWASAEAWEGEARFEGLLGPGADPALRLEGRLSALDLTRLPWAARLSAGRGWGTARATVSVPEWGRRAGADRLAALSGVAVEGRAEGLAAGPVPLPDWTVRLDGAERPTLRLASAGLEVTGVLEDPARLAWSASALLQDFRPGQWLPADGGIEGAVSGVGSARGVGERVVEGRGEGTIEALAWGPLAPSRWAWSGRWDGREGVARAREPRGIEAEARWTPAEPLAVRIGLADVPLEGWVAGPEDLAGRAGGEAWLRWAPGQALRGGLRLASLTLRLPPLDLAAREEVRLHLEGQTVRVEALTLGGQGLQLSVRGQVEPGRAWGLDVDGSLDLSTLRRWVPAIVAASGEGRAAVEVRGDWAAPRFEGPVRVLPGAALSLGRFAAEDIDASGFLDSERGLVLDWADAQVGAGRLHLEGVVGLDGVRPGDLRLLAEVRDAEYEWPPQVSYGFDADLLVTGTAARPEVRGEVRVLEFLYARRLNWKSAILDLLERKPRTVKTGAKAGAVYVDVLARGAENLRVENNLAELSLAVELRARGYLPEPALWGRAEVVEGTVRLRAQEYEVLRSAVEFLGEAQPVPLLDLHARTTVRQHAVSVDVSGPLDDYRVTLASSPPMPQTDLVALLTVGSTPEEMAGAQAVTAAEAASLVTGRLQDELESGVGAILGFDQFHIDPAYSPSAQTTVPRITVGKAVTRSLYARYSAALGGEGEQDLEVQYAVTPRLSLLGTWTDRGPESRGSLGGEVRVRFSFR